MKFLTRSLLALSFALGRLVELPPGSEFFV